MEIIINKYKTTTMEIKKLFQIIAILVKTGFGYFSGHLDNLYITIDREGKGDYISIETLAGGEKFDMTIFVNDEVQEFLGISFDEVCETLKKVLNVD